MISKYQKRPIRFIELYQHQDWTVKIYSISVWNEFVDKQRIEFAKTQLPEWFQRSEDHALINYKKATLLLHECKDVCFAIINWWVDENMLQHFVYVSDYENPTAYKLYSDNGIVTCVWEMAVLWFERNAWVKYVLEQHRQPDFEGYLLEQFNNDI